MFIVFLVIRRVTSEAASCLDHRACSDGDDRLAAAVVHVRHRMLAATRALLASHQADAGILDLARGRW